MLATLLGAGIAWWVWIEQGPCFRRDGVGTVHCRWSEPISVTFPFIRCPSMDSGLPLL